MNVPAHAREVNNVYLEKTQEDYDDFNTYIEEIRELS